MNRVVKEDIEFFKENFPFQSEVAGRTFLITGATGLIGGLLTRCLLSLGLGIRVVAPVRNAKGAASLIEDVGDENLTIIERDIQSYDYADIPPVDYIFHCASPTASDFFVENPVETSEFVLESSIRILRYAKENNIKGTVFLSSLEVYGEILNDVDVPEDVQGYVPLSAVRSSYPLSKRMIEHLCSSYAKEYHLKTYIARLTQTTGAGVSTKDNRVIVQFVRKAVNGEDIIMLTSGESARPYVYTTDALIGLFFILFKGESGIAYNIANEDTYISAGNLAVFIKEHINSSINIIFCDKAPDKYPPASFLKLSSSKLKALGWKPEFGLEDIVVRLRDYFSSCGGRE